MGIEILEDKNELLTRLEKRTIVDPTTECWLWQGALNYVTHGHGIMKLWKGSPKFYTHRLSAYIFHGYDMNSIFQVNHNCSNQNCWNPKHIYVGTQSENMGDVYKHQGKQPKQVRTELYKFKRKYIHNSIESGRKKMTDA